MAWSPAFISALNSGATALVWRLSRINLPYTDNPGSAIAIGSAADSADSWLVEAPTIAGAGVSPVGWMPQVAATNVSVAVYTRADAQRIARSLPRGTAVLLEARTPRASTWEPVFLGTVETMTWVGSQLTMAVRDIRAAIRTRIDTTDGPLFHELTDDNAVTLGSAYTAGDSSITLSGASYDAFRTNGTAGAILITPSSGDPFILTYTGRTGATLSGVSSTAIVGTTAVNASGGDAVAPCAYLTGHPFDIARRVLASTGSAANGAYDDYPESWGLGISDQYMDHADTSLARQVVTPWPAPSSPSSYSVVHVVTAAQSSAFDWLAGFLATFGSWMTTRQGRITFRAATDPKDATLASGTTPIRTVNRDEVVEVAEGAVYSSLVGARVYQRTISYDGGTVSAGFSLPYTKTFPSTTADAVDLTYYTDDSAIANDVAKRVYRWEGFPPRLYTLVCTLGVASLCDGDWVALDLDMIGHDQYPSLALGDAPTTHRRAMVLNVDPDYRQGLCRIVVGMTSSQ